MRKTTPAQRTLRMSADFLTALAQAGPHPGFIVDTDPIPPQTQVIHAWIENSGTSWVVCLRLASAQWPPGAPDECHPLFHTLDARAEQSRVWRAKRVSPQQADTV